ncbi:MAG: DUF4142 domain-containing protein [Verrucomicrobiales bacterium]|nr:DUF4142 domain-containing protein [Verrucomicrobiales bacterium]
MQKRLPITLITTVVLAVGRLAAETPAADPAPPKDPARTTETPAPAANLPPPILKVPGKAGAEEQFVQSAILDFHRTTEISRLAMERGQNAEVKQLASALTADHSAMTQDLVALAQRKGVENPLEEPKVPVASPEGPVTRRELSPFSKVPQTKVVEPSETTSTSPKDAPAAVGSRTDPIAQHLVQKLQALYGDAFDKRYLQELSRQHDKATQNCEQASRYLADEDLKKFAAATLPKLQEHRQRITELAQRMNVNLASQEQASR